MRQLILGIVTIASLLGCAKIKYKDRPPVEVQNCTVANDGDNAVISCPDGTTVTLPPTVVIQTETVEVPVLVEVPSQCHHDNGNHNGHHNHEDED